MKRREMREQGFLLIFELLFSPDSKPDELIQIFDENVEPCSDYAKELLYGVCDVRPQLNDAISKYLIKWKIKRIPRVSLAILYVAVYEIDFLHGIPISVVINEAVELAKKYAGQEDAAFINGVLGKFVKNPELNV